ncbi:TLDc domain-containing protein [Entamoeba marina]
MGNKQSTSKKQNTPLHSPLGTFSDDITDDDDLTRLSFPNFSHQDSKSQSYHDSFQNDSFHISAKSSPRHLKSRDSPKSSTPLFSSYSHHVSTTSRGSSNLLYNESINTTPMSYSPSFYQYSNTYGSPLHTPRSSRLLSFNLMSGSQKYSQLKKWTGMNDYDIIFDSQIHDFSPKVINSLISGKPNVMFIVITCSNEIFGCYNDASIPLISTNATRISGKEFFAFSLQFETYNPILFQKRNPCDRSNCMRYGGLQDDFVFDIDKAFSLKNNGEIMIFQSIFEEYDAISKEPLTICSCDLEMKHFIVLVWS